VSTVVRPRRILVVRTDRIGDVVLATPLLRALRRTFPDAFLAALVRPYTRDVLVHNPHLDTILTDDPHGADAGGRGFRRQVAALRRHRFDTALLLMPTERAAWLLFWAGIPRRIGVGRKFYEVVTGMRSVSRHRYVPLRHEADYCLDLGRAIGVRADAAPDLAPEVFVTDGERAAARRELGSAGIDDSGFLVGLHPTGGGSAPNWDAGRWVALAAALLQQAHDGVRIVVSGEMASPPFPPSPHLVDRRGRRPLHALMADLACCNLVVAPSTGPLHLAAALGVPTIGLYCPLPACSPALWGPLGDAARVVVPPAGCCPGRCPRDPKQCRFEEIGVESVAAEVRAAMVRLRGARSPAAPQWKRAPDRRYPEP
jgi:heptosyltransferase-2